MQTHYLSKILKLKGYSIKDIEENDREIIVHCISKKRGMCYENQYSCSKCANRIKSIKHIVIEERIVILKITQRRFYFKKKDTRRWESLPGIKKQKRTSEIFRENTLKNLRKTNYTGVSEKRFVSKMFPLRLLDEIPGFKINWDKKCSRIGLDNKSIRKYYSVMNITNLDTKEVITILPKYSKNCFAQWCKSLSKQQIDQIKEVCVDMSDVPISTIKQYFPKAKIVIDHFHVIQWAIKLMDQLRNEIQQVEKCNIPIKHLLSKPIQQLSEDELLSINQYLNNHLDLKCFWKTLHLLRKVYWQKDYSKARKLLRKIIWICEQNGIPQMLTLAKTLRNWFDEILNYYISKTTNAYTEGIHTKLRQIKQEVKEKALAKMRQMWFREYEKNKNVAAVCRKFGIHRSKFYYWFKRLKLKSSGKGKGYSKYQRLMSYSREPKTNPREYPEEWIKLIIKIRKKTKRGSDYIWFELRDKYQIYVSVSGVYKVLKRKGLVNRRKQNNTYEAPKYLPGDKVQIDVKYVKLFDKIAQRRGKKYRWVYQYTALDVATGIKFKMIFESQDSQSSIEFLTRVRLFYPFKIKVIQTDNGFEFTWKLNPQIQKEHLFTTQCKLFGYEHYLISPAYPRSNSHVERTHRTDEEEVYRGRKFTSLKQLHKVNLISLKYFNEKRPQKSKHFLSPLKFGILKFRLHKQHLSYTVLNVCK